MLFTDSMYMAINLNNYRLFLRIPDRYMVPVVIPTGYCSVDDAPALKPTWRFDMTSMVYDDEFGSPFVLDQQDIGLKPESDDSHTNSAAK